LDEGSIAGSIVEEHPKLIYGSSDQLPSNSMVYIILQKKSGGEKEDRAEKEQHNFR